MQKRGKATQLDNRPVLDYEEIKLWNLYASLGDSILVSLDIYANRIGFPFDWRFDEVLGLVHSLSSVKAKLTETLKDGN